MEVFFQDDLIERLPDASPFPPKAKAEELSDEYIMTERDYTDVLYSGILRFTVTQTEEDKIYKQDEVTVGCDPSRDYIIASAAPMQATFLYEREKWFLRANDSPNNSTLLNGNPMIPGKKYQLIPNDQISFTEQESVVFYRVPCYMPKEYTPPMPLDPLPLSILDREREFYALIGHVVDDRYTILKFLSRGAFFKTYLVMEKPYSKLWAMKIYEKRPWDSPQHLAAISRSGQIMSALSHPAIPKYVDAKENAQWIYTVREYVPGISLDELIQQLGSVDQSTVLSWAKQLCDVLCYLHKHEPPYLHRDIKPANIFVEPSGAIKLTDFNTLMEYDALQKCDPIVLGTRGYSAPEQYRGHSEPRTDIYSLGITLHYLLTGQNPIGISYHPLPIRDYNPDLSPELEAIIQRCIQAAPEDRFRDCEGLMEALQNVHL